MRNRVASLLGAGSHSVTKCLETVALVGHSAERNHVVELGGIMTTGGPSDSRLAEIMERALQLTEDALEQITRIAVVAALLAATVAVLLDRARAARRKTITAAA